MTQIPKESISLETLAPRTYLDRTKGNRPLSTPIIRGAIFAAPSSQEHARLYQSNAETFYHRFGHPGENELAKKVAALEDAESAIVFASGMATISTTLMAHLASGSHVISGDQIFAQTQELLEWLSNGRGVRVDFVDMRELDLVKAKMRSDTRIIYIETPSNPKLRITDIAAIAALAKEHGAMVVVDSTFATPMAQQPLKLGASIVLHSATKFIAGHMDVMGGVVAGPRRLIEPVYRMKRLLGGILDPQAAWLILRGIKTLHVRAQHIFSTALQLARYLESAPAVRRVYYPHLESHGEFQVASRQMLAGGGVVSFTLNGDIDVHRAFLDALQLVQIATSLGGVETVIEMPYDLDWYGLEAAPGQVFERTLIRLSVGLEHPQELIDDIEQALRSAVDRAVDAPGARE